MEIGAMKKICKENIDVKYHEYIDSIGLDNFIRLSNDFGGTHMYIPTPKELQKKHIYEQIRKSLGLFSVKEIAKMYNVSEKTVYRIKRGDI